MGCCVAHFTPERLDLDSCRYRADVEVRGHECGNRKHGPRGSPAGRGSFEDETAHCERPRRPPTVDAGSTKLEKHHLRFDPTKSQPDGLVVGGAGDVSLIEDELPVLAVRNEEP